MLLHSIGPVAGIQQMAWGNHDCCSCLHMGVSGHLWSSSCNLGSGTLVRPRLAKCNICVMPKRGKPGVTDAEQLSQQFSLLDLPDTALALVSEHSKPAAHPLLGLSRACRDAVLSQSKKISLKITSSQSTSVAPTARLLNRACCTALEGLHLDLDLSGHEGILAQLLQPKLEQQEGCWSNVHKLAVHAETSRYLHLLSSVVPALHHLRIRLNKGDLGDGGFFSSLQPCTQLTALHLEGFTVSDDGAAMAAAAALARLPNLRELALKTARGGESACPSALVKHLTALTCLCLHNNSSSPVRSSASLYAAAARNPGLLSFSVDHVDDMWAPVAQVEQLLEACPSLTHLGLDYTRVEQDSLDAILTYGTNITSLNASRIEPDCSIAGREVSWRKLVLTDCYCLTTQHLANLPLQSVTSLQLGEDPDATLARLELPTRSVPAADLPGLLLEATTNLAKCPAWRSEPQPWVLLYGDPSDDVDDPPATTSFNPEQLLQLIQALAPLGGPHVAAFQLSIEGLSLQLGRAEVAALAQSLGKGLRKLELSHCNLTAGFWAALDDALPSLQYLTLREQVNCSAANVGIYCGKRSSANRLVLRMSPGVYQLCQGDELHQGLNAQGLGHITVRKLPS